MKLTPNICCALLAGLFGFAEPNCFAQLTPEQLLERGRDRGLFTNDFDGAIADFTLVIAAKTNLAEAYAERGQAYARKTNYDTALLDYDRSIQADSTWGKAYRYRASTERKMGNIVGCIADIQRAVQLAQTNASLLMSCASMYKLLTNWDRAIDCCSQAIKLEPRNWVDYEWRAFAECAKGDWQSALSDMNQTIRLSQAKPGFSRKLDNEVYSFDFAFRGSIENQLQQYFSATADAARAMGYVYTNGFAYSTRAWARFGRNDISGAIEDCKTALKFNQDFPEWVARDQGLLCFITKDYENAIVSWNKAVELSHQEYLAELQPWIAKAKEGLKAKSENPGNNSPK